jgi:hypothetical protein
MDPKETYKLMSQRFYDRDNNATFVPEELDKFIDNLGRKKFKSHYDYTNLDELYDAAINVMLDPESKDEQQEKFILKLEGKSSIVFYLNIRKKCFPNVEFSVRKKNSKDICIFFEWYPFLKFIYINNLFYNTGDKKKLDPNKDCEVFNIPEKSGEFFINLFEDISIRFGVKNIILQDASTILYDENKINLALFYLQKHGKTYYGKFGFQPIKPKEPNSKILFDIAYKVGFNPAKDDLNYVKKKLKHIPKLTSKNYVEWVKRTNELKQFFPEFYLRKIK